MDPNIVNKEMIDLTMEMMERFYDVTEGQIIEFSDLEKNRSEYFYQILDRLQKSGELSSSANSADLMILADCIVYREQRLEYGILYLVTGDKELQKAAIEIVEKPHLIYPDIGLGKILTGFRMLEPEKFRKKIESISEST